MKILTAHDIATRGIHEYPNLNRLEYRSKKFVDLDYLLNLIDTIEGDPSLGIDLKTHLLRLSEKVEYSETMYEGKYKVCGECYHTRYKE